MRKTLHVFGLTLLMVGVIDLSVAGVLEFAEKSGRAGYLIQYFEYGRSVPGKYARWIRNPAAPDNVYHMAWGSDVLARSRAEFAAEQASDEPAPVIRAYGLSFVHHILREVESLRPDWRIDPHHGNGAPPNFTYAMAVDDQENRRAGDVNVLGILSSAVPALFALSNRTVFFEQPAPYTYPIFRPDGDGDGLSRIDPLIASAEDELSASADPIRRAAWQAQLESEDAFFSKAAFGWPGLDRSPLARLIRRSLAVDSITNRKREITRSRPSEEFPHAEILRRILVSFSKLSREGGQVPFVLLIQTRDTEDVDVLEIARPVLEELKIPYLATADHYDPGDPSSYLVDGHFVQPANFELARLLVDRVRRHSDLD